MSFREQRGKNRAVAQLLYRDSQLVTGSRWERRSVFAPLHHRFVTLLRQLRGARPNPGCSTHPSHFAGLGPRARPRAAAAIWNSARSRLRRARSCPRAALGAASAANPASYSHLRAPGSVSVTEDVPVARDSQRLTQPLDLVPCGSRSCLRKRFAEHAERGAQTPCGRPASGAYSMSLPASIPMLVGLDLESKRRRQSRETRRSPASAPKVPEAGP